LIRQANTYGCHQDALKIPLNPPFKKGDFS
jgi:hypothetical protein